MRLRLVNYSIITYPFIYRIFIKYLQYFLKWSFQCRGKSLNFTFQFQLAKRICLYFINFSFSIHISTIYVWTYVEKLLFPTWYKEYTTYNCANSDMGIYFIFQLNRVVCSCRCENKNTWKFRFYFGKCIRIRTG